MLSIFTFLALLLSFASTFARAASSNDQGTLQQQQKSSWPGWNGIRYWFAFGDSYTTIGFNVTKNQPSPSNPLGNPAFPGLTSSNGPNYVGYLTTKYNASLIQTVDLAFWGATVDDSLIAAYSPIVKSVKEQVATEFFPYYTTPTKGWSSQDTLFSVFIGINDVANSYRVKNTSAYPLVFNEYGVLVEQLYGVGARNFLFLNVPPVQYSPTTKSLGKSSEKLEADAIDEWNDMVTELADGLRNKHPDTAVFNFDTYSLFRKVQKDPTKYKQTEGYKNTTGFCPLYQAGTPAQDTLIASCKYPVNQYLWLNGLHVTYPMHDLLAEQLATSLSAVAPGAKPCVPNPSFSFPFPFLSFLSVPSFSSLVSFSYYSLISLSRISYSMSHSHCLCFRPPKRKKLFIKTSI
ncbi:hypothetical protein IWX49DRAFT_498307 [Phyllosticta citricarpa]|uniref:Carbohydrate esterase family 16 protein n=1 Tax=Phyllosticta citricarpa TaxID=55181 RepID=A0ABR1MJF3_9PEZI